MKSLTLEGDMETIPYGAPGATAPSLGSSMSLHMSRARVGKPLRSLAGGTAVSEQVAYNSAAVPPQPQHEASFVSKATEVWVIHRAFSYHTGNSFKVAGAGLG
jgi:hypothetical protein